MCFWEGDGCLKVYVKVKRVFGFEITNKTLWGFGGPGGTKKWVPPVWSEGAVGVCRKNQKGIVLIFVVLS